MTLWEKEVPNQQVRKASCNSFHPGQNRIPKVSTEVEAFRLFFDKVVIDRIVECTNLYISKVASNLSYNRNSSGPTDKEELEALIGLLFLIGTLKSSRTQVKHLWNIEDGIGFDICRCAMSYERFTFLMRVVHFDDYRTRSERKAKDKFCHIRDFFEWIVKNFQKYYTPSEYMTIDEQLLPFRGRCPFKVYIPSKPVCYGIKTFALVDVKTFYTFNLETYTGKPIANSRFNVSNQPKDVVLRLVQPIKNSGRNITADNWFTSIELIIELQKIKLSYVGTMRKNKAAIPPEFLPHKNRAELSSLFSFMKFASL